MSVTDHFPKIFLKHEAISLNERQQIEQRLEADMARFFASGGEVQTIPSGVSAERTQYELTRPGRSPRDTDRGASRRRQEPRAR